ncbi:MAG TPA: hypothetical protein VIV60_03970 [Polyangiaceae bacterium]
MKTARIGIGLVTAALVVVDGSCGCVRADLYPLTADSTTSGGGYGNTSTSSGNSGNGSTSGNASQIGLGGQAPTVCPSQVLSPGDASVSIQVGSTNRTYVLHVPTTYDGRKPVPLVVDFHGIGSSGWGELSSSPYPAVTDREAVVMAFPDGLKGPAGTGWNMGPCCVADVDDVSFAKAVVADVQKTACIDPSRIYAVGVLTGGGMVHYLACHAADLFAGAAPAAFDLLKENIDDCHPARPISVISFRSTAVGRVPYAGGASTLVPGMPITFLGAKATFDKWAQLNGCSSSASQEDSNGCSSYSTCQAGVEVMLCSTSTGADGPGDPEIAWPLLKRHAR